MKKELVNEFVENIESRKDLIKSVIKKELGVDTIFKVNILKPSHTSEQFVRLIETGNDTTRQMTATPLLSALFSKAHLEISADYDKENHSAFFTVNVQYDHNYRAGSNGHDLMGFSIDFDTNEYRKY